MRLTSKCNEHERRDAALGLARPCPALLRFTFWHAFCCPLGSRHSLISKSVSFVAVPPRSHYTTVTKGGSAPLGQHKY